MTGWIWIAGVLAALLAALYCRVSYYGSPQVKLLFKGAASLAFVVLGLLCAGKAGASGYAALMSLGLVLGAVGDVLLQWMECRPQNRDGLFRSGLGAFLAGHVFYIAAFMLVMRTTFLQFALALALFAAMFILQFPAKVELGAQKGPVYAYAAVISLMAGYALCGVFYAPQLRTSLMLAGGLLFFLSDVILALMLFSPAKRRSLPALNLSAYYVAQILLALSIAAM